MSYRFSFQRVIFKNDFLENTFEIWRLRRIFCISPILTSLQLFSPLTAAFSHPTSELSITSLARYLVTIAAETSKNTGVLSNSQNSTICKEPLFFSTIKFIHELALQPTFWWRKAQKTTSYQSLVNWNHFLLNIKLVPPLLQFHFLWQNLKWCKCV